MEVRPPNSPEAQAVCTVLRRSITELCGEDHGNNPEVLDAWLTNKTPENVAIWIANPDNHHLVAVEDGAILGVGCIRTSGEIMLNYVSPDARFRGVSKAIIIALEDIARGHGHAACTLDSTETAHRFYQGLGYASNGRTGEKFGLPNYPMIKQLTGATS
jgi:GNAT superfamily N-acetyltransferase